MNTDKAIQILAAVREGDESIDPSEKDRALALAQQALRKIADAPLVEVEVDWNSCGFITRDAPTRRQVEILDGMEVALVAVPPEMRQ